MRGPAHRDTDAHANVYADVYPYTNVYANTDAHVHADAHADIHANVYVDTDDHTHLDAHATPLSRLSAAYREVEERLTMRFLSIAILLSVALLVTATFPPVAVGQTP